MKKILKGILILLLILLLIVGSYVAYVFISYHRIEDNKNLDVSGNASLNSLDILEEYEITSWNIGFAAYLQDYGFFMDGGTESRAYSKKSVLDNMDEIISKLKSYDSDFYLIQEVDFDSTRTYHVDEEGILIEGLGNGKMTYSFAQNYDSPYLFYPIFKPHGASKSGLLTLSKFNIYSTLRKSLPIQTNFAKLLDLDRCLSVNRFEISNGKELVLINFHLSAYTTDPTIITNQIKMLNDTMVSEIEKGNYVIAGGDFNADLLGNSGEIFGVSGEDYSWAKPFPVELLSSEFTVVAPFDATNPVPSCRNADGPYDKETQFQLTIDGFIVSNNIEVTYCDVINNEFLNSDHNPVQIHFILQ